jgi:hypothetical protein
LLLLDASETVDDVNVPHAASTSAEPRTEALQQMPATWRSRARRDLSLPHAQFGCGLGIVARGGYPRAMGMPEHVPDFDLYAELEVAPTASAATIDAAWRSLVKRHHPDAARTAPAAEPTDARIRRLNIAHDWLTDPDRRERYDRERALHIGEAWRGRPSPAAGAGGPPSRRNAPREDATVQPDWEEVRYQAHRSKPPPSRPRSLMASPLFNVAFGLLFIVVSVGGFFVLTRVLAVAQSPTVGPAAPPGAPTAIATATPARTPSGVEALADTVPDHVGGIDLVGATGAGSEVFGGDEASLNDLVARTGATPGELIGAYKAGEAADGRFLSIIVLRLESVAGPDLADAFLATTRQSSEPQVTWSDGTLGGRTVAVSRDQADPEIAAYVLSSADAMYLVISSDPDLADAAIRALP